MLIDALTAFVAAGAPAQSLVAGAGVAIPIGNPFDLMGSGVGTAPPNIIGNASLFGMEPGAGLIKLRLRTIIGVAATTSTSATLNLQLQYAPDTGAGGNYQPGTWTTIVETGALAASVLTVNTPLPELELEPAFLTAAPRPRFVRANAVIASATSFTAGTISFCGLLVGDDVFSGKQAARNYTV